MVVGGGGGMGGDGGDGGDGGTVGGQIKLWKAVARLQCASGCFFSPRRVYLRVYVLSYTAVTLSLLVECLWAFCKD